jgi:multidrug efflux pump subunit AcrA (membrane-fusion protein)
MTLLIVEQAGSARLEATLDDARAGSISVGQPVDVQVDGMSGHWISTTVSEVGRTDSATHSFLVKADLPTDVTVRTGTFGRGRFALPARRGLTVPATSLVRRGQLAFVFIADDDAHARLRPVTPGPNAGTDRIEILAGLTAGERILTSPAPSLRDGTPIVSATVAPEGGR